MMMAFLFFELAFASSSLTTNSGLVFVRIPKGQFEMGSPSSEKNRDKDERSSKVELTHDFYVSQTEITQAVWTLHMKNESRFQGDNLPVESLDWFQAVQFANAFSKAEGVETCYEIVDTDVSWPKGYECRGYRLPTEAEWERAARGGKPGNEGLGGELNEIAWIYENSGKTTHPVGQKKPNDYGLYDMFGNVAEWVWDLHENYSKNSVDPKGAARVAEGERTFRVRRGGGYTTGAEWVRPADRYSLNPENRHAFLGIRLVRTIPNVVDQQSE
ncbi:MAG: serine/threonine protein kinase [Proteobacteria bacterium]|nr:serine/threonine protein kinase [Pseudomonadota bacterium]